MYDVITVGSATVDVFARAESELIRIIGREKQTEMLAFPAGTKLLINKLSFTTGGGGTNSAVSIAKMGLKVAFLGKVGSDDNAEKVMKSLKTSRVDTTLVRRGNGETGYSIILDSIDNDRVILACKGINDRLSFSEINRKGLKTKWLYFSSMVGESYNTLEKLAQFAGRSGIQILFNPSSYLAKEGPDFLKKVLKHTTVLVFNMAEAMALTGKTGLEDIFKCLFALGPTIVVITCGKSGTYASDRKHLYRVYPKKVRLVESTGAGDAFASAFLAGLIKKGNMLFALDLGTTNAESVITHYGAKNKLLTYREALMRMRTKRRISRKKVRW